jgi:uncharacterized protein (TIGR03083 family)
MHLVDVYQTSRTRLIAQATNLTQDQIDTVVPATPLWTVGDVYRHLTGVCSDILTGRLEGRGTPAWTGYQVSSRSAASLADVCAEWEEIGPKLEAMIHASGFELARPCFDVWTHEQDIAGAVGSGGNRNDAAIPTITVSLLAMLRGGWAANPGLPAIEFVVDGEGHRFGEGEPEVSLRATGYEFIRTIISRRSREQILAADWTGDPTRVLDALCVFPLPENDLAD